MRNSYREILINHSNLTTYGDHNQMKFKESITACKLASNQLTCKDINPCVGIFWLYKGTVLCIASEISCGSENIPGLIDSKDNHSDVWDSNPDFFKPYPELMGSEYYSIPRGRVLFNKALKMSIIYMDEILFKRDIKKKIISCFNLENVDVIWKNDIHYTTKTDVVQ